MTRDEIPADSIAIILMCGVVGYFVGQAIVAMLLIMGWI